MMSSMLLFFNRGSWDVGPEVEAPRAVVLDGGGAVAAVPVVPGAAAAVVDFPTLPKRPDVVPGAEVAGAVDVGAAVALEAWVVAADGCVEAAVPNIVVVGFAVVADAANIDGPDVAGVLDAAAPIVGGGLLNRLWPPAVAGAGALEVGAEAVVPLRPPKRLEPENGPAVEAPVVEAPVAAGAAVDEDAWPPAPNKDDGVDCWGAAVVGLGANRLPAWVVGIEVVAAGLLEPNPPKANDPEAAGVVEGWPWDDPPRDREGAPAGVVDDVAPNSGLAGVVAGWANMAVGPGVDVAGVLKLPVVVVVGLLPKRPEDPIVAGPGEAPEPAAPNMEDTVVCGALVKKPEPPVVPVLPNKAPVVPPPPPAGVELDAALDVLGAPPPKIPPELAVGAVVEPNTLPELVLGMPEATGALPNNPPGLEAGVPVWPGVLELEAPKFSKENVGAPPKIDVDAGVVVLGVLWLLDVGVEPAAPNLKDMASVLGPIVLGQYLVSQWTAIEKKRPVKESRQRACLKAQLCQNAVEDRFGWRCLPSRE
jgi:hypothetical protein